MKPTTVLLWGIVLFALVMSTGCRTLKKAVNGPEPTPTAAAPLTLDDRPTLGDTPNFALETPPGWQRRILYGFLDVSNSLQVAPGSTIAVFVEDVGYWFQLGQARSAAYYYQRSGNTVSYMNLKMARAKYCIYEYTPIISHELY